MSKLRDATFRLATQTERQLTTAFDRYARGDISRSSFELVAAQLLAGARARGVALADLSLTADHMRALRRTLSPVGLMPPEDDFDRLRGSFKSVLDEEVDYAGDIATLRGSQRLRIQRLGRDSAAEIVPWALHLLMNERGAAGWTRETDRDPCTVCRNLADGIVRSPAVVMKRHTGCMCVQRTVF